MKNQTILTYDELVKNGELANGFEKYHPVGYWRNEMEKFHQLLPSGRIIEIGAGGGAHAEELIKMGYGYVGTDASANMIRIARKRLPNAKFYQQSVEELKQNGSEKFDGFWSAATLLHIPKDDIDHALQRIKSIIKPDAIGFVSMMDGTGEELLEETWANGTKHNRYFAYFSRHEFTKVLKRNGFTVRYYNFYPETDRRRWHCFFVSNISKPGSG